MTFGLAWVGVNFLAVGYELLAVVEPVLTDSGLARPVRRRRQGDGGTKVAATEAAISL